MKKCTICAREFHDDDVRPEFLKHDFLSANQPNWSKCVCMWCWGDFEATGSPTEERFLAYVSNEFLRLARRAAQGKSLMRCDAVCWNNRNGEGIKSHRCRHYIKGNEKSRLCGLHQTLRKRGHEIELTLPSPPRYYIAARNADEFVSEMRRLLPAEWVSQILKE